MIGTLPKGEVKEMDVRPRQNAQGGGLGAVEGRVEVQSFCRDARSMHKMQTGLGADTGREEEQQLVLAPVI